MGDVLYFSPVHGWSAQENLRQFLQVCRSELSVFGAGLDFEKDRWDITSHVNRKSHRGPVSLLFTELPPIGRRKSAPMQEPFKSFAKSAIRYLQGLRPSRSLATRLVGLRALHQALMEDGCVADPTRLIPFHFNRAVDLIKERVAETSAYQYCGQLEVINKMMVDSGLLAAPMSWRSSVKRVERLGKVGPEFDRRRLERLPSAAALSALASIFTTATEPSDVMVTSVMAILCSAPERINEVLRLTVDSEVTHQDPTTGEAIYGLRWYPSKGAKPQIKWTVKSMTDVAKLAFRKMFKIGASARELAAWYQANPTKIFLSADLEHLRSHQWLTMGELAEVLFAGSVERRVVDLWCHDNKVHGTGKGQSRRVRFEEIERVVLGFLPTGFPISDVDHGLQYSQLLFLVRRNELHKSRATYRCMFMRPCTDDINNRLSAASHKSQSIFEKYGFREPDGTSIRATTHQIRHYLNTLAQRGGLSQLDIALWSGRARVSENNVYDHVSNRDVLAMLRAAVGEPNQTKGPLARLHGIKILKRSEFARLKVPTAHTTDLGYCIHDYSMLPCQAHQDCLNCDEHICVKGEPEKEERLKLLIGETKHLLAKAEEDQSLQLAGVPRWVDHQKQTLARAEELQRIMDDPAVPAGAVISISTPVMPSRLAQAVQERQKLIELTPTTGSAKANRRRRA
ncbi:integrase [Aquabacterium sp. CECT 9606]|uniref:integrase n=1 Tax=Aquabacterium sp. CECT 9606 TaxID=2845822 RepID=UPI001E4F8BB1|nr:integrase [Aquabacterium sp. CECT 9606]CAH0348083.1 hypothetical protein AQB9606_00304 [Aquabacterium sp. CECT 9606]